MKTKMGDKAVAESISAILLLAIAVAAFSAIYMNVLSDNGPNPETFTTIVGSMVNENGDNYPDIVFQHTRGETLDSDTEVILDIGGGDKIYRVSVADNPDMEQNDGNTFWSIGERFVYYPRDEYGNYIDLNDINVRASIIDKETDSLIFWGVLQEGWVRPAHGKGGIWHFNESSWNGTFGEVKDSSGNENHGTAFNGANTTDDVVSPLANRSGIFNVFDNDDYVEVEDDYTLDIMDEITMEAWVKPFLDSFGTIGLLDQFGYTPYITNLSGSNNLFAIVSEDSQHEANLQTINITPHKPLTESSIVDVLYNFAEGNKTINQNLIRPIITNVSNDVYLIAYNSKNISGAINVNLKTFNISSNGTIKYTGYNILDDNDSFIGEPNRPSVVKVCDFESYSIIAIAYGLNIDGYPSVGIIKTLNISHDGNIKFTGEMEKFENIEGYGPSIIRVTDELFAIAYRSTSNLGVVKTYNISSDGSISYTGKQFIFDDKINDKDLNPPSIVKVSDKGTYGVFAIAYGSYTDNTIPATGIIKTINIYSSNGTITGTGFNKIFEYSTCYNPYIIHQSKDYFIIVFDTKPDANSKGKYILIQIEENGDINNIGLPEIFDDDRCQVPIAIKISERVFGIVYESIAGGSGHPGYLKTIQVEFPSDVYSIGIHKLGSYGIYVNPVKAYVNINTITINTSVLANAWNYIVLTYDRQYMKLYVNGILKTTKSMTEAIKITNNNLIFGDLFYGLLDEVGIYDTAFSYQEVQDHFKLFAPIIVYNINSSEISYTSAKITWNSNVPGSSILRFGTTIPPTNEVSNLSRVISHEIILTGLTSQTTYYYEIQSTDEYGNTIIDNNGGRYYTFTTQNLAPNVPRMPNPRDGFGSVKIDAVLKWVGGDEEGDIITYDVYFNKTGIPLTKVSANQSTEYYDPDLEYDTKYFWQIIAWDNHGASAVGPIWTFSTKK